LIDFIYFRVSEFNTMTNQISSGAKPPKFLYQISCLMVGCLLLTACHGNLRSPATVEDPQIVASPDKVTSMLAQAADRASNALETLAAVEQKRTPQASVAPIAGAPAELMRAVTINWIGPADQMAKTLANRAGYQFQQLGAAPATPVIVSLDVTNKPIIEVMRSMGLQLGARADIRVDSTRRMVELMYAPTPGAGEVLQPMPMDGMRVR
jgi:defect in organelle trafficking protein DotD